VRVVWHCRCASLRDHEHPSDHVPASCLLYEAVTAAAVAECCSVLSSNAAMLADLFSLTFAGAGVEGDSTGTVAPAATAGAPAGETVPAAPLRLVSLPLPHPLYPPPLPALPRLLLTLGLCGTYTTERRCVALVTAALARFFRYSETSYVLPGPGGRRSQQQQQLLSQQARAALEGAVRDGIVPALRATRCVVPAADAAAGRALLVADLRQMYKAFERC
jgi:hypothetical protein